MLNWRLRHLYLLCDAELCDYSLKIGYMFFFFLLLRKPPVVWMFIRCMSCISAAGLFPIAFRHAVIDSPVQGSEMDIMYIVSIIVGVSNCNVSREILKVCDRFRMVRHTELKVRGVVQSIKLAEEFWKVAGNASKRRGFVPFCQLTEVFPLCQLYNIPSLFAMQNTHFCFEIRLSSFCVE